MRTTVRRSSSQALRRTATVQIGFVAAICVVLFLENAFLNALAPLLPSLRHELRLSTAEVGLIAAAYAIGAFAGTIPSRRAIARFGLRSCTVAGLLTVGAMSVAFGVGRTFFSLFAFRLIQGLGAGLCWTATMAWLLQYAPAHRRGQLVGLGTGAAAAGSVMGPLLGSIAATIGRGAVFSAAGILATALAAPIWRLGARLHGSVVTGPGLQAFSRSGAVRSGALLVIVTGVVMSGIAVLGPLRLADLGFGAGQIGACFVAAAVFNLVIRPTMGRWADRNGISGSIRYGLLGSGVLLLAIPWPTNPWLVAILVVLGLMSTSVYIPATMIFLSDACAAVGAGPIMAAVIVGLCWPPGSVLGSAGGGALAQAVGLEAAFAAMAITVFLSAVFIERYNGTVRETQTLSSTVARRLHVD